MKESYVLSIALLICLFLFFSIIVSAQDLTRHEVIWKDKGKYSAFTSLAKNKKYYYCAFRQALSHVEKNGQDNGEIVIIRSKDTNSWRLYKRIALEGYDLRDPKLIVNNDREISVMVHAVKYENGSAIERKNLISNLSTLTKGEDMLTINFSDESTYHWLWDAKWIGNKVFGYLYIPKFTLVSSSNGINYTQLVSPIVAGLASEAVVESISEGKIISVVRVNGQNSLIGLCNSEGLEFKWYDSGVRLESPSIIKIKDQLYVSGRYITKEKWKMSLFLLDQSEFKLKHITDLPGGGDCAYPGMVYDKGYLYISYYNRNESGGADIHLSVLKL